MFTNSTVLINVCIQTACAFIPMKKWRLSCLKAAVYSPYSVRSIRKVKIHDFYFQGEKKHSGVQQTNCCMDVLLISHSHVRFLGDYGIARESQICVLLTVCQVDIHSLL